MIFQPKIFYDSQADSGGGDTSTATTKQPEQADQQIQQDIPKSVVTDEELKRYGLDSKEALITLLEKQKESSISAEEKKEKENLEKANFIKYSTENKLLNVDDYRDYENIKAKSDHDLVFDNYLSEYKSEHAEITDDEELLAAAKEDFEYEFKLRGTDAAKKKGEAKLAREAAALREPHEKKITEAQTKFKDYNTLQENYPKFDKFVDKAIKKNTPDKTVAFTTKVDDGNVEIEIELTQADRDAIAKEFKTAKTYHQFANSPEKLEAALDKKIQGWIKVNKFDEVNAKSLEKGIGIGTYRGSTVGAENPFAMRQGSVAENTSNETLEQSNARLAAEKERYRQGR